MVEKMKCGKIVVMATLLIVATALFSEEAFAGEGNLNKKSKVSKKSGNKKLGASIRTDSIARQNPRDLLMKSKTYATAAILGMKKHIGQFEFKREGFVDRNGFNFAQIRIGKFRLYAEKGHFEIALRMSKKVTPVSKTKLFFVGGWILNTQYRLGIQFDAEIAVGTKKEDKNKKAKSLGFRVRLAAALYSDVTAAADFALVRVGFRAKVKVINFAVTGRISMPQDPEYYTLPRNIIYYSTRDTNKAKQLSKKYGALIKKYGQKGEFKFHYYPVVFTVKAVVDARKWNWKKRKFSWKEKYSIVLFRWYPNKMSKEVRSFLTF
ncbi:MAG: hypothetical protein QF645_04310 [Planctomycetota bacterium]|nr:hypothetical protein [Planctomycetota bacterium]